MATRTHRDPTAEEALGHLTKEVGWIERNRRARARALLLEQQRAAHKEMARDLRQQITEPKSETPLGGNQL